MIFQPIHPFPARMAPEIALEECAYLQPGSKVLDPMSGSGTVLRVAAEHGHHSVGCDSDPLAALLSQVWVSGVDETMIVPEAERIVALAKRLAPSDAVLPWIDNDPDTQKFIEFWFVEPQRSRLRDLAFCLQSEETPIADALRVCLSRLIITKSRGASLGRDVSHSRPHRVGTTNDFDVFQEFVGASKVVSKRIKSKSVQVKGAVHEADARSLPFENEHFDAVITSPPYLNAIDYMRGHKLSLVWLGYSIGDLSTIRSNNVGTERGLTDAPTEQVERITSSAPWFNQLEARYQRMASRYVSDLVTSISEVSRVLKEDGRAVFVIGNSCVKGVYIENASVLAEAAALAGLKCRNVYARDIPSNRRYLPTPERRLNEELSKRMRRELILAFEKS